MSDSIKIQTEIQIDPIHAGSRLDVVLAKLLAPQFSRSQIQQWIAEGDLRVDGKLVKAKFKLVGDECVQLDATQAVLTDSAEPIPLSIVAENDDWMIINKPVGLVVHPAPGHRKGTLLNAVLAHHAPCAQLPRAGIVHRLDKDTSGVMVVAKTLAAYHYFVAALRERTIRRQYIALVHGELLTSGSVSLPIGRHPKNRLKMHAFADLPRSTSPTPMGDDEGSGVLLPKGIKPAISHYRVLKRFQGLTLVSVSLETGRTHQIRVHLSYLGYPIVGDQLYGGRRRIPIGYPATLAKVLQQFPRQALHAYELAFSADFSGPLTAWRVPLADDIADIVQQLESQPCNASTT